MARVAVVVAALLASQAQAERWFELQLIPVSAQINVADTEHVGSGGKVGFHWSRFFGVYVGGLVNWHNEPTLFQERIDQTILRFDVGHGSTVLSVWQVHAGVQSIPLEGSFSLFSLEGTLGLELSLGVGPTGTAILLGDIFVPNSVSYPDTGVRVMGHAGVGLRFGVGRFALHLGLHGSAWSNEITTINRCTIDDVRAMDAVVRGGGDRKSVSVSAGCHFEGNNDLPLALNALRMSDPKLNVNVAAELGASWAW